MDFKVHFLIGALASIIVFLFVFPVDKFMLMVLAIFSAFSALVPDLDHETSKLRKLLNIFLPLGLFAFVLLKSCPDFQCSAFSFDFFLLLIKEWLVMCGLYFIVMTYLKPKHRGITHTLFAGAVYGLLVYSVLGLYFGLSGLLGYCSHLLADNHMKMN